MYGYIKGIIKKVSPEHIIVENNGIGYLIVSPVPYSYKLETEVCVYTHYHVREDAIILYGFKDEETLKLFQKLISVSGIGPKSALSIVAFDDSQRIVDAIESGDAKYLTKFPGIGNKSASQIILDLKGKLVTEEDARLVNDQTSDIIAALQALGYNRTEINKTVKHINVDQPVDKALKEALAYLLK